MQAMSFGRNSRACAAARSLRRAVACRYASNHDVHFKESFLREVEQVQSEASAVDAISQSMAAGLDRLGAAAPDPEEQAGSASSSSTVPR